MRKHEIAETMEKMRMTNDFTLLDKLFANKNKNKNNGINSTNNNSNNKNYNKNDDVNDNNNNDDRLNQTI